MITINDTETSSLSQQKPLSSVKDGRPLMKVDPGYDLSYKRRPEKSARISLHRFMVRHFSPHAEENEIVACFLSLPQSARDAFCYLVACEARNMPLYMGQKYLGEQIDTGREWTNKVLAILKQEGFIDIYGRGMTETCVYRVSPFFQRESVRKLLQDYVPTFKSILLGLILFQQVLSAKSTFLSQQFTPQNRRTNITYNSYWKREESKNKIIQKEKDRWGPAEDAQLPQHSVAYREKEAAEKLPHTNDPNRPVLLNFDKFTSIPYSYRKENNNGFFGQVENVSLFYTFGNGGDTSLPF